MPLKIKICGITTLEDAQMAVEAGADAIGFMFYPASPRSIKPEAAARIARRLSPFLTKVGVFVDADDRDVRELLAAGAIDAVQFHGGETPGFCRLFGRSAIKAFRINGADSLADLRRYDQETWLLDSYVPGIPGGTGAVFNWDLAVTASSFGRPIILAGGLKPENVASAVRKVSPYGVDVSSGVESSPGKKDPLKVREFIRAAREGNLLLGDPN